MCFADLEMTCSSFFLSKHRRVMFIYTRHSFTRSYSLIPVSICFCHFKSSRVSITNLHQRKKELNEACHSLAETVVYFSCDKLIFFGLYKFAPKSIDGFLKLYWGHTHNLYNSTQNTKTISVQTFSYLLFRRKTIFPK